MLLNIQSQLIFLPLLFNRSTVLTACALNGHYFTKCCSACSLIRPALWLQQEMAPQVALQQLALPLQHPQRQQRGLATLQSVLWNNGQPVWEFPSLHMDRSMFLQAACSRMTASEQVHPLRFSTPTDESATCITCADQNVGSCCLHCIPCLLHRLLASDRHLPCCLQVALFENAPEGAPVPGDELYQIALAHVVEAMLTFSPARITTADKMLSFLASQSRYHMLGMLLTVV